MKKSILFFQFFLLFNCLMAQEGLGLGSDVHGFVKKPDDGVSAFLGFDLQASYLTEVSDRFYVGPGLSYNLFMLDGSNLGDDNDKLFSGRSFVGFGRAIYEIREPYFVNTQAGYTFGGNYLENQFVFGSGFNGRARNGFIYNVNYNLWGSNYHSVTVGGVKYFGDFK